MRAVVLDDAGRRVLRDATDRHGATPEALRLLSPVADSGAETPAEAAEFIETVGASFAGVDRGLIAVDHRPDDRPPRVIPLAVGSRGAFFVSGDGERVLISQPVPLWSLASDLALEIGWREDSDDAPPSTATTAPAITALQALAAEGLADGLAQGTALARLDEVFPGQGSDVLGALADDGLVGVEDGTVSVGGAATGAPGLVEAMSRQRLELIIFELPRSDGDRPEGATRLSFLGPSGGRYTALREDGSPDVTLAQLELGELLTLIATFLAARAQPLAVPVGEDDAAEAADVALDADFRVIHARELGDDPAGQVLLRPSTVLEITGDGADASGRMGVSVAGGVAVAWIWRRTDGRVRVVDAADPVQALADLIESNAADVFGETEEALFVDARQRAGDELIAVSVPLDGSSDRDAIAAALENAGWR